MSRWPTLVTVITTALIGTVFLMSLGQWCVHCQACVKDTCCSDPSGVECEEYGCCNPLHSDHEDGDATDIDPGGGHGDFGGDGGQVG